MIIPSINCKSFEEAKLLIEKASQFSEWIHIDVSDGKFGDYKSWGNPDEFAAIAIKPNTEVHLMIENPEEVVEAWLKAGVKRIIVHLESTKDLQYFLDICEKYGAKAMLAISPHTEVQKLFKDIPDFKFFQILAVNPGPSGQILSENAIEKVKFLRVAKPNAKIEIDGGINLETAKLAKGAGADILVSEHFIFNNPNPKEAYQELNNI